MGNSPPAPPPQRTYLNARAAQMGGVQPNPHQPNPQQSIPQQQQQQRTSISGPPQYAAGPFPSGPVYGAQYPPQSASGPVPQRYEYIQTGLTPAQVQDLYIRGLLPRYVYQPVGAEVRHEPIRIGNEPTMTQQTTRIQNYVSLKKETLKLKPLESQVFQLCFDFDAHTDCRIYVYFCTSETTDTQNNTLSFEENVIPRDRPRSYSFLKGTNQHFETSVADSLDLSSLTPQHLQHISMSNYYPLVIVLEPVLEAGAQEEGPVCRALTTYASINTTANFSSAIVRLVKQKAKVEGASFELQEIYGLDEAQKEEGNSDCVICMTNPRDTTIYPCRHFVLCAQCAAELRSRKNQCPICRCRVDQLMSINVT